MTSGGQSMQRFTRAAGRRALLATVVAGMFAAPGLAVASTAAPTHPTGHKSSTQQLVVPVDRQDYVTNVTTTNPVDGTTIDPYNADPSSIHVATQGGQEFARSFVHLALGYLPNGAAATDAVMTLHLTQQSDASNTGVYPIYNVNQTTAIVQACALTTELATDFDPGKPPAYDCQHGSSVGHHNAAADTWTFDLKDLLAYWKTHGNTGAALIPVATPGASWQVAFYRSRSVAKVAFQAAGATHHRHHGTHPSTGSTGGGMPTTSGSTGGSSSGSGGTGSGSTGSAGSGTNPPVTGTGSLPGAGTTTSTGTTPSVAPPGSPAVAPAVAPVTHHHGSASWPWVLLASLGIAGAALAAAHREQVLAALSRLRPAGLSAFRARPRAYAVASAALAWGLVFSGYSLVVTPPHSTEAAADSSPTTNGIGGTTTTPSGSVAPTPGAHSSLTSTGTTTTTGGTTSAGGTT
ncbi:MAG: hypothetical protein JO222_04810, partial [Frankiales bacterium]|nr:hypothetical protein [Frankiales bacterium]